MVCGRRHACCLLCQPLYQLLHRLLYWLLHQWLRRLLPRLHCRLLLLTAALTTTSPFQDFWIDSYDLVCAIETLPAKLCVISPC